MRQKKSKNKVKDFHHADAQRKNNLPAIIAEINSLCKWLQGFGICLNRQNDIIDYLLMFPGLIKVIRKAAIAVCSRFPETQNSLEVYRDPEIEDQYLVLYVRARRYDERFMEQIEEAEKEYIDLLAGTEGWFQLTTDFRRPEVK